MSKSGLADSPFFAPPPKKEPVLPAMAAETSNGDELKTTPLAPTPQQSLHQEPLEANKGSVENMEPIAQTPPVNNSVVVSTMQPSKHASMHASNNAIMQANKHSSKQESIIETIRKVVKDVGKDSVTYRFTPEEKKALLELSFSYKMQGYKTSENELSRIAINFLLEDQRQNGRNSVLQKVLDALNK